MPGIPVAEVWGMVRIVLAIVVALLAALTAAKNGYGQEGYVRSLDELPRGLDLPLAEQRTRIMPTADTLLARLRAPVNDPTIEAVELAVPGDERALARLVRRLAAPGKRGDLARYIERRIDGGRASINGKATMIRLDAASAPLLDMAAVARALSRPHRALKLSPAKLKRHPTARAALLAEIRPFLTVAEHAALRTRLSGQTALAVDEHLLPRFGRDSIGRFHKYRGPNCFRAALGFQDPGLPSEPAVNAKVESGYHRAMINNDELWWALQNRFDEVDVTREAPRYGDVLAFFDVKDKDAPIDHRWLQHASVYLFNEYTFSKESNAANSPYVIKTLSDEWRTWKTWLPGFGVKVFRYRR